MKKDSKYILSKIKELKAQDPDCKVFGANLHQFKLNPVLSEQEIVDLETKYLIKLPDDYRWFLMNIGNGGAGPCYGIMKLQESIKEVTSCLDDNEENEESYQSFLGAEFVPPQSVERARRMDYYVKGMIPVSDAGCCMYYHLCLAGVEKGNMWFWSNDNMWRPVPAPNDKPDAPKGSSYQEKEAIFSKYYALLLSEKNNYRISFLDWYCEWLENPLIIKG